MADDAGARKFSDALDLVKDTVSSVRAENAQLKETLKKQFDLSFEDLAELKARIAQSEEAIYHHSTLSDEIAQLKTENAQLQERQTAHEALSKEVTRLSATNAVHRTITPKFAELAKNHHGDGPPAPRFHVRADAPELLRMLEEVDEDAWFEWVDKELRFTKHVRSAYAQDEESYDRTANRKRGGNDSTLTPQGLERKRACGGGAEGK
ncbi:hypothetical protein N0V95_001704 [Ascochyta clinopodiicola]|nr:hypothetical protein N0V95_001704 [Ascochyta clinopodiicola]